MDYSFRFRSDRLNKRFIESLKKSGARHTVGRDGTVHYASTDVELIENEILNRIRGSIYDRWQVLTCPRDWTEAYRTYMVEHKVPFTEEQSNGRLWFLIPRRFRPHSWKLAGPQKVEHRKRVG